MIPAAIVIEEQGWSHLSTQMKLIMASLCLPPRTPVLVSRGDVDRGRTPLSREALFLDLDCREVDLEALPEMIARLTQNPLPIVRKAPDADMPGEQVTTRGQAPGMDVMHVRDTLNAAQIPDRPFEIQVLWRALQQDPQRGAQDAPRRLEEDDAEGHAEDRVDLEKAGEADHHRGDDDDQAADEGLKDVPEGAL